MLPESCRSRMVRILAAIWRLVPPCSTAAHLLHCFDYFFPLPRLPFLHPLFLLPHEYIKVHAFLPNITCVHEQTDPSLSPLSQLLLTSRHTKLRFTCWQRQPSGLFPLCFSLVPLSLSLHCSLFIFSSCLFQLYIHTHIFLPKEI